MRPAVYDFSGRTAIVTGAAGGFGRAIAARLAAAGAAVAMWDVDLAGATLAAGTVGANATAMEVDTTDEAQVAAAASATASQFGRVDMLVNNAGVLGPVANTWEHSTQEFRRVLDINLTRAFICCLTVVPLLLANAPDPAPDDGAASSTCRRSRPMKGCPRLPPTRHRKPA